MPEETPRHPSHWMRVTAVGLLLACMIAAVVLAWTSPHDHDAGATSPNDHDAGKRCSSCGHQYTTAAASSDGRPCATIAVDILKAGGTAADGAIAGMLCSGIVNPHSMGLGGGFLLTYYSKSEGKAYALNARESAPAAATRDMFQGDQRLAVKGPLAVAVPGEVRGYVALYERFGGGVPWRDLLTPSVRLCEEGIPVSWHLARALQSKRQEVLATPSLRMFVSNITGDVMQEGDTLFRHDLASTLRELQRRPDSLYTGPLATKVIGDLTVLGGIITLEDLANYKPEWTDPVQINLEGINSTLFSVPPPGSGAVLAFIINVLEKFQMKNSCFDSRNKTFTYQRLVETFKYAYALRTRLGDPRSEDLTQVLDDLTSDEYAMSVKTKISDNTTSQNPADYGALAEGAVDHGTSHLSVMAANGDAVSVTSTINTLFGAVVASQQTGVIFNNEMDDFSSPNITNYFGVPPSPVNFIKPGKRPQSSMSPAILVGASGEVRLVLGAAGGTRISTAVAAVTIMNAWCDLNIEAAIRAPRIHHQLMPMQILAEEDFSETVLTALREIGHKISFSKTPIAVVNGIARTKQGRLQAFADTRKAGESNGY